MRAPLRFRNPLVFPGGVRPGIDYTHPALINVQPGQIPTLQSWIPTGRTLINLTNGVRAGTTGTVNAASTVVGPATVYPLTANNYNNYTPPAVGWSTATFGSIFILTAAGGAWLMRTAAGSASYAQSFNSGVPNWQVAGNPITLVGLPACALNTPYFYGVTIRNQRQYGVLVNLSTGQIWTGTSSQAGNPTETSGLTQIGAQVGGQIAAQMGVAAYIGLGGLLAWAERPWDFWYPPTLEDMILSTGKTLPALNVANIAVTEAPDVVGINAVSGPNVANIAVTEARDAVNISVNNATVVTANLAVTEAPDVVRITVAQIGQPGLQFGSARRARIRLRSPLAFPGASAIAGINRRHPAYTSGLRHSSVALGNGCMVNLLTGKALTVGQPGAGPQVTVMTQYGPAVDTANNWAALQVPPVIPNENFTAFTGAAIVYVNSLNANNQHLCGTSSINTSQDTTIWLFGSGTGFNGSNRGTNFFSTNPFPVVVGHCYFFAASASPSGAGGTRIAVCVDLTTGQVTRATAAGGITSVTVGVNYCVGSTQLYAGAHVCGMMLAAMMSNEFMTMNDLSAWAERPWDWWYPPHVESMLFGALRTSGIGPVVQQQARAMVMA